MTGIVEIMDQQQEFHGTDGNKIQGAELSVNFEYGDPDMAETEFVDLERSLTCEYNM